MILHHEGTPWLHEQPALAAIHGRGMDQLVLEERDVRELRGLEPAQLNAWLEQIHTHFTRMSE